jgi:hypothetical protein
MGFSIIHPTRSRPEKSFEAMKSWKENSTMDCEWIVSIDHTDPMFGKYINIYSDLTLTDERWLIKLVLNYTNSSVCAINKASLEAEKNILMVVSDDTGSIAQWDQALYGAVSGKNDWILKTQDGIQSWILTFPILDRSYYNRFGYIYYPGYQHLFCDTELTCVADITGRKITSNLLFPHNHYSIGKSVLDSVYSKNDRTNEQGEKLFLERYARNFDLPKGNPITDGGMINWLKKRHVNA